MPLGKKKSYSASAVDSLKLQKKAII